MGTYEYTYTYLAQAYGNGDYGNNNYGGSTTSNTSAGAGGTTGSGNSGSPLANTGLAIAVIVTLACLILFAAVLVRWWRRPRTVPATISSDVDSSAADKKEE